MAKKNPTTEMIDKIIGRKINELRIAKGLSGVQVAALIDVTHQQLRKYEKGTNRISAGRLMSIAKALGVNVNYFFDKMEKFVLADNENERLIFELARVSRGIKDRNQLYTLLSLARTLH